MTEMSGVSEMSGVQSSVASSSSGDQQDSGDNRKIILLVLCCLALLSLIGVVIFLLAGSSEGDTTGEGESGGGSGGGGGGGGGDGGEGFVKPPSTTTTATTTTTLPPYQLICTVGSTATMPQFYPADSLCQYLYYTHVVVIEDKIKPIETNTSYTVFEEAVANYKVTEGGLSFDMRYVNPAKLSGTAFQTLLSDEKRKRIYHLGSLNIQFDIGDMKAKLDTAETMLKSFKTIQQSRANSKTIMALGTFGYSTTATWKTFKDLVKRAAAKNFKADTVILISSYSFVRNISDKCITVPPNALETTSAGLDFPSLNRLGELVKKSYTDNNQDVYMGLSLEMGAMTYHISGNISKLTGNEVYQKCTEAALASTQLGCQTQENVGTVNSETQSAIATMRGRPDRIVLWDSLTTITSKLKAVKAWPPRRKFAWLLLNVHLINLEQQCKTSTQEKIIGEVKSQFPYTT